MSYPTSFEIMELLEQQNIHYRMDAFQPDVLTITASLPGQIWEIQCRADEAPDLEVFVSDTPVQIIETIEQLRSFSARWADPK